MSGARMDLLRTRAALSRMFEPSDNVGLALVEAAGPHDALRVATGAVRAGGQLTREVGEVLAAAGISAPGNILSSALERWSPRIADLAPDRDLAMMGRAGGELLIPEDSRWPEALRDLELGMPLCLWARGDLSRGVPALHQTAAVVGSRDSTGYGASATGDIAAGLVTRGWTVVSGGAYGIDAQAHRAALAAGNPARIPTIAVMACGVDRYYPAGNEDLLREVVRRGLLLSEVPPGSSPTRWRFLQRNRIIAALSAVTVVVEARWRSGALNTAHHAAALGREVGAVPGSVYSANSAGCHRLLRDGSAVCVTDAAEVAELGGPIDSSDDTASGARGESRAVHDGLTIEDMLLLDALPLRSGSPVEKLASVAGLSVPSVRAGLARLELEDLAARDGPDKWRRSRR
ncbi:DNA-processing protein DprA [Arthrobacter sp. APC 3897]|nr:DNA-processing protein DprA [Arthrobacter sp. APC 3897]